jgi:hypothetical protein
MNEYDVQQPKRRMSGGRIALIVTGALASLLALTALGVGAVALWADGEKDQHGYLTTDDEHFRAETRALTSGNVDLDLDGAGWLFDSGELGRVRLSVAPQGEQRVFVGIARTEDVSSYLRGVDHTRVTDVDSDPFDRDVDHSYRHEPGRRLPAAPGREPFWVASAQGRGTQTVDWRLKDGDWSVVLMNADGSPGVVADVEAGAKVPFLNELGWSAIGGGALLLIGAVTLIVLGARPPRNRPPHVQAPTVATAS